jgi:hypothetical protein
VHEPGDVRQVFLGKSRLPCAIWPGDDYAVRFPAFSGSHITGKSERVHQFGGGPRYRAVNAMEPRIEKAAQLQRELLAKSELAAARVRKLLQEMIDRENNEAPLRTERFSQ